MPTVNGLLFCVVPLNCAYVAEAELNLRYGGQGRGGELTFLFLRNLLDFIQQSLRPEIVLAIADDKFFCCRGKECPDCTVIQQLTQKWRFYENALGFEVEAIAQDVLHLAVQQGAVSEICRLNGRPPLALFPLGIEHLDQVNGQPLLIRGSQTPPLGPGKQVPGPQFVAADLLRQCISISLYAGLKAERQRPILLIQVDKTEFPHI